MTKTTHPIRGEVWLVNFDPSIGSEIKKTRPAVILQNDIGNTFSPVTIVAALGTFRQGKTYPTEVLIQKGEAGLENISLALLNQIRTIDKKRLVKKLGKVKATTLEKIENALKISFGLIK